MEQQAPADLVPVQYDGAFGHRLHFPAGLALDDAGRVWVADTFGGTVHRYAGSGRLLNQLGDGVLDEPRDVATSDDRVYVADSGRGSVEIFTDRGRHVGSVGRGVLDRPRGVAVDAAGRLLVSDVGNNRIAVFDAGTHELVGAVTDGVHTPHGISADADGYWVVSSSRQYDGDGGATRYVADRPTITLGEGQHTTFGALSNPAHVAVDSAGQVLVTVADLGFVSRFSPTGPFTGEFGTSGRGLLRQPLGIVVDRQGRVLVADAGNRRVVRFREAS